MKSSWTRRASDSQSGGVKSLGLAGLTYAPEMIGKLDAFAKIQTLLLSSSMILSKRAMKVEGKIKWGIDTRKT